VTPVHLVAGHLGAGKTSVLRHLLARRPAGERVGLVVNDFGEAAVDDALLSSLVAERREIRGSCVCCTAPEGFAAAVAALLPTVDRLFVEPTGLARPADLVDTLRRAPFARQLALGPVVVVVDPEVVAADPSAGDGLAVADVVVVNRTDRASPGALAALRERMAALRPGPARIVETTFGAVDGSILQRELLQGVVAQRRILLPPGPHDPAVVARSVVLPPEDVLRRDALEALLAEPGWVRAKGLVRTDEGWLEVQRAAGVVTMVPTAWRTDTRIDLLATDAARADELLSTLSALHAPAASDGVEVAWPGGSRTFGAGHLAALAGVDDVGTLFPGRVGRGVPLPALLRAAGAPGAGTVVVTARDGFVSAPAPLEALAGGVLVYALGDGPLPAAQGGPFRVLVPGAVGCANVKAVARLVVR
jgi:G3E family GTPase